MGAYLHPAVIGGYTYLAPLVAPAAITPAPAASVFLHPAAIGGRTYLAPLVAPPVIPPDPTDPGPSVYAVAVIHDDDVYRIGSFL